MSVIVKGMEMPDNCRNCNCTDDFSCCIFDSHERECDFGLKVRPDWCPLVELPEKHGRLVDADYMRLQVDMRGTNKYGMLDDNIRVFIDQQPTVIEAEGDE